MTTVLVTGDRAWANERIIQNAIIVAGAIHVIEGGARGADTIAGNFAESTQRKRRGRIMHTCLPAEWDKHGRAAGAIRNRAMLDLCPDIVLAFHDRLWTESKGTRDCVEEALRRDIPVFLTMSDGFGYWVTGTPHGS